MPGGPYGFAQVSARSPESELQSSRDRSESIEDGNEEREAEDEEEEVEEVKAEDKALVPVEGSGNMGDAALMF